MRLKFEDAPEELEIWVDDTRVYPTESKEYFTLADVLEHYEGIREYEGIVAVMQNWYYGYVRKTAWCAVTICWGLAQLGLRNYTLEGKSDNVYQLDTMLEVACEKGHCKRIDNFKDLKRGDIVVFNFSPTFTPTSKKHVSVFGSNDGAYLRCIGGNQSDQIKYSNYRVVDAVSAYRPHYQNGSLKRLEDLPSA